MDTRNTVKLWVCIDCMLVHANGECTDTPDRAPWALWENDSSDITMGLLWSEHECETPEETFRNGGECDCETDPFSMSDCDGCGSTLAGERHAFTAWLA